MKKNLLTGKPLSMLLALVLLASPVSLLKAQASQAYDDYFTRCDREVYAEQIDGMDYRYVVVDGEAAIVHIRTNYNGPEKIVLTFPTTLGGYPVTSIGYITDNSSSSFRDIFINLDWDSSVDSNENDPGLLYITDIVIPEGYETINNGAMGSTWWYGLLHLPKSLKRIDGPAFETWYVENDFVFPECQYDYTPACEIRSKASSFSAVVPIRCPSVIGSSLGSYGFTASYPPSTIYLPPNTVPETIEDAFCYVYLPFDGPYIKQYRPYFAQKMTLYCVEGSDICTAAREWGYNVVTDIPVAESVKFASTVKYLQLGASAENEAVVSPADATWKACDYASSDPSVVKVDAYSGKLTAVGIGTATVTATCLDGGFTDTCTVVVSDATISINNNPGTKTLKYGESLTLTANATGLPEGAQIKWFVNGTEKGAGESFTFSKATADSSIAAKIVSAEGETLLDAQGSEISDTCAVAVTFPTLSINNNPGTKTLKYGESLTLTANATGLPEGAQIKWFVNGTEKGAGESFTLSKATADSSIAAKIVSAEGETLLDAQGSEISDTVTVTVKANLLNKIVSFVKSLFVIIINALTRTS